MRRQLLNVIAVGGSVPGCNFADIVANATAVFERQHHGGINLPGIGDISVSGQVAQVGFFGAGEVAVAVEEKLGVARNQIIFGRNHLAQSIGDRDNIGVCLLSRIDIATIDPIDACLICGICTVNRRIQAI